MIQASRELRWGWCRDHRKPFSSGIQSTAHATLHNAWIGQLSLNWTRFKSRTRRVHLASNASPNPPPSFLPPLLPSPAPSPRAPVPSASAPRTRRVLAVLPDWWCPAEPEIPKEGHNRVTSSVVNPARSRSDLLRRRMPLDFSVDTDFAASMWCV
jgi:hypothetical protein